MKLGQELIAGMIISATLAYFVGVIIHPNWTFVVAGGISIIFLLCLWVGCYFMPKRPNLEAQTKQLEANINELTEKVSSLERDILTIHLGKR